MVFFVILILSIVVFLRLYWVILGIYFEYIVRGDCVVIIECYNGIFYFGIYGVFRWEILDVVRD